jgi:hypothetical protein
MAQLNTCCQQRRCIHRCHSFYFCLSRDFNTGLSRDLEYLVVRSAQTAKKVSREPLTTAFPLGSPRNRIHNKRISDHSRARFALHDFASLLHDAAALRSGTVPHPPWAALPFCYPLRHDGGRILFMTDFATGVQRWCSCLDCVLTGLISLVWPPAFACQDFGRFASGFTCFARGSFAVGLRHVSQPQRFRSRCHLI